MNICGLFLPSYIILFYVYVPGLLFLLAYSGVMFLLGSYASAAVASVMQASSLAALIASKVVTLILCRLYSSISELFYDCSFSHSQWLSFWLRMIFF